MQRKLFLQLFASVTLLVIALPASAQNLLVNPGFESGVSGWSTAGDVSAQTTSAPQFVAHSGSGLGMLAAPAGCNDGDESVFYQEFPTLPGAVWGLSTWTRHWSGDPMTGIGAAGGDSYLVMRIAYLDAGDNEIGGAESTILDGTFATDTWHANPDIMAVGPAGTVKVRAIIAYRQGANGCTGAAHIDSAIFRDITVVPVEPSTWGQIKSLYRE